MGAYTVPTVPEIIVGMHDVVPEGRRGLTAESRNPCDLTQDSPTAKPSAARNETLARQLDDTRRNASDLLIICSLTSVFA